MKNRSARRSTAHSVQILSSPRPKSSASAALHWRTASLPTRWSWRCTAPVKKQGHKSLDYTLGILRRWDNAGVHTVSEITALEPETRTSAVSAVPAAVGQTPAQPTDSATLAAWEQDWAARVRSHRRNTEE